MAMPTATVSRADNPTTMLRNRPTTSRTDDVWAAGRPEVRNGDSVIILFDDGPNMEPNDGFAMGFALVQACASDAKGYIQNKYLVRERQEVAV